MALIDEIEENRRRGRVRVFDEGLKYSSEFQFLRRQVEELLAREKSKGFFKKVKNFFLFRKED